MKKGIKQGQINYIIDIIIGAALVASIFSGVFLLFLPSGEGFRGGRNPGYVSEILGMDRWFIKDMHTFSSIAMAAGVLGHLILHWNWIVCMTRNIFRKKGVVPLQKCEVNN